MVIPNLDFDYVTKDYVVECINDADKHGVESPSGEYIAAAYAFHQEAGNDLNEDSVIEHFDELRVAGAEFDVIEALAQLEFD
ncbi:hypothetical protein [Vibrio harveyi]|uniref:hypothetical protein n=1 Tax=Vibrio harveyi TaxID=669 RepID=UPI0024802255|nr:hypothetical protein [Vibrio harveyi]